MELHDADMWRYALELASKQPFGATLNYMLKSSVWALNVARLRPDIPVRIAPEGDFWKTFTGEDFLLFDGDIIDKRLKK